MDSLLADNLAYDIPVVEKPSYHIPLVSETKKVPKNK